MGGSVQRTTVHFNFKALSDPALGKYSSSALSKLIFSIMALILNDLTFKFLLQTIMDKVFLSSYNVYDRQNCNKKIRNF